MTNKILIAIIALLLALVLALSISACFKFGPVSSSTTKNNDIASPEDSDNKPIDYSNTFYLVDALFKYYSIFDIDYETAMLSAIRAYVEATGDKYAMFYTPEEFSAMQSENQGDLYGIGVQVIFDYEEYFMEIVLIMPDSPAQDHLVIGDKVTHIYVDGEKQSLADVVEQYKEKTQTLYPNQTFQRYHRLQV